jgi:hypothetical protein
VTRPVTVEPEFVPMVPVKTDMDESGIAAGAIFALLIL